MVWLALGMALEAVAGPVGDEVTLPPGVELPPAVPDEVVRVGRIVTNTSLATPVADRAPDGLPSLFHDDAVPEQRYAMRQTFTSQMKNPNPFSSKEWRSTHTQTYALVRLRRRDARVEYLERTCSVETEKVFGAETVYTQAFIDAIDLRWRVGMLAGDGPGARLGVGPYPQQFGVYLDDPFNDPLPTDPNDPHVVDADGDGLPGVTVVIRAPIVGQGKVWIIQRSVARLEGTVGEGGRIEGVVRTAPDMVKIDADRWWLRTESPQRPHPDPRMSPFVLVPVGADVGCAAVLDRKDTLFPPVALPPDET